MPAYGGEALAVHMTDSFPPTKKPILGSWRRSTRREESHFVKRHSTSALQRWWANLARRWQWNLAMALMVFQRPSVCFYPWTILGPNRCWWWDQSGWS